MPETRVEQHDHQKLCPHCSSPQEASSQTVSSHAVSPQTPSPQVIVVPAGGRQTVWWVIAVALAVIATSLVSRRDGAWLSGQAMAQAGGGSPAVGARGIYAFTGQLSAKDYGLFMLDVDTGTLWCYEMARSRDGAFQLQLVAARSWIFDRFLEEFNVAKPTPGEVQLMVRQQREQAARNPGAASGLGSGLGNTGLNDASPAPAPADMPATEPVPANADSPFAPALPQE